MSLEAVIFFFPLMISLVSLFVVALIIYWYPSPQLKAVVTIALSVLLFVMTWRDLRLEKQYQAEVERARHKRDALLHLPIKYMTNVDDLNSFVTYQLFDRFSVQIPPMWKIINTNDRRVTFGQGIQPYITIRQLPIELSTRYTQNYGKKNVDYRAETVTLNDKKYTRYTKLPRCAQDTCNPATTDWFVPMSDKLLIVSVSQIGRSVNPVPLIITTIQEL